MKYCITYDDLFGHTGVIDEHLDLDKAREAFKAECYSPASIYDDFLCLESMDDDDEWVDILDDYQFTRLDREDE